MTMNEKRILFTFGCADREATVTRLCYVGSITVDPMAREQILELAQKHDALLLVEENSLMGGFTSAVLELLADHDMTRRLTIRRLGLPDRFIPHGPVRRLRDDVGINVSGISSALEELISLTSQQ